jgi:IS30 family transposase
MLDEMEQVTGLDRKTLIRQMKKRKIERKVRRRQRGKSYGAAVDDALRVIAETLDYICAERITPNLVSTAQHLALHGELDVSASVLGQLERISVSTVRRKLKVFARLDQWHLPRRKGPKPPNPVARAIEMRVIPWDEREPGHFEVDTVHHSGPCAGGDYVHTVQMTDVATEWCELAAALGRSQRVMEDAFRRMLARLPFPVREIHPDNGSEFLNHHLVRFWGEAAQGIQLSRSRPFHKNDNRFVEQKNFTLVRAYLGHERLDSVAQTLALNALYDKLWLYYNFFQPVLRLTDKTPLSTQDGHQRFRRTYGKAQTPFQRLCATGILSQEQRHALEELHAQTNPRRLRQEIYSLLQQLFALPGATPGQTENVLETLIPCLPAPKGVGNPVILSFERTIPVQ